MTAKETFYFGFRNAGGLELALEHVFHYEIKHMY